MSNRTGSALYLQTFNELNHVKEQNQFKKKEAKLEENVALKHRVPEPTKHDDEDNQNQEIHKVTAQILKNKKNANVASHEQSDSEPETTDTHTLQDVASNGTHTSTPSVISQNEESQASTFVDTAGKAKDQDGAERKEERKEQRVCDDSSVGVQLPNEPDPELLGVPATPRVAVKEKRGSDQDAGSREDEKEADLRKLVERAEKTKPETRKATLYERGQHKPAANKAKPATLGDSELKQCEDMTAFEIEEEAVGDNSAPLQPVNEARKAFVSRSERRRNMAEQIREIRGARKDRAAWARYTELEVFSDRLGYWQSGIVLKITRPRSLELNHDIMNDTLTVVCYGERRKLYLRRDDSRLRSTDEFIKERLEWSKYELIEVYTYVQYDENYAWCWCQGEIKEVEKGCEKMQVSCYEYPVFGGKQQAAIPVNRWAPNVRPLQLLSDMLIPYEKGSKVMMNIDGKYERAVVTDVIPSCNEVVVKQYEGFLEMTLSIWSEDIRLSWPLSWVKPRSSYRR